MVYKNFMVAILFSMLTLNAKINHIMNEDDFNTTISKNKRVIVEFSADWCSVCNGIQKPFEEIADEAEFQGITFAQVDVDKLDGVSKQNGIVGVPTFVLLENGNKKVEEIGVQNMPTFKEHLRDNLRNNFDKEESVTEEEIQQAPSEDQIDQIVVEEQTATPAAPAAPEPNFFIRILTTIKNFIMAILIKIKDFFMTIVDAIKGLFG